MNRYLWLIEAQKIYLNPQLSDYGENLKELGSQCYYKLSKYPDGQASFWDLLLKFRRADGDSSQLIASLDGKEVKLTKVQRERLISNLKLALKKKDQEYLDFLISHRSTKLKLKLKKKDPEVMLNPDIAKAFGFQDDQKITRMELRSAIHLYIKQNQLQDENQVKLDSVLVNLIEELKLDEKENRIEYLRLIRAINGVEN